MIGDDRCRVDREIYLLLLWRLLVHRLRYPLQNVFLETLKIGHSYAR